MCSFFFRPRRVAGRGVYVGDGPQETAAGRLCVCLSQQAGNAVVVIAGGASHWAGGMLSRGIRFMTQVWWCVVRPSTLSRTRRRRSGPPEPPSRWASVTRQFPRERGQFWRQPTMCLRTSCKLSRRRNCGPCEKRYRLPGGRWPETLWRGECKLLAVVQDFGRAQKLKETIASLLASVEQVGKHAQGGWEVNNIYIHTYIHTYIHACIHTYIHTYI